MTDTEAPTMTLTEFLLARIAEDEHRWCGDVHHVNCAWARNPDRDCTCGYPARVLAECEAKRRIVVRHRPFSHGRCQACYVLAGQDDWTASPWPCADLRDLAAVYGDHPDYRPEWRP